MKKVASFENYTVEDKFTPMTEAVMQGTVGGCNGCPGRPGWGIKDESWGIWGMRYFG